MRVATETYPRATLPKPTLIIMTAGVAEELRTLASRVRRNVPRAGNPEAFHEEASEIAHRLIVLAEGFKPSTVADRRRDRTDLATPGNGTTLVNGRTVVVQRERLSYRIHVEGKA